MEVGRNAISRNLSLLREMHYPIRTGPGGKGAYLEPLFNDMELRVLIDSVLLSRYIPPQEARELIGKLTSLGRAGLFQRRAGRARRGQVAPDAPPRLL